VSTSVEEPGRVPAHLVFAAVAAAALGDHQPRALAAHRIRWPDHAPKTPARPASARRM